MRLRGQLVLEDASGWQQYSVTYGWQQYSVTYHPLETDLILQWPSFLSNQFADRGD
jgi:hypothetical protein